MQPAAARAHALPALLSAAFVAGAAILANAGCDAPRPYGILEVVRDQACTCKDLACAEGAELALGAAIAKVREREAAAPRRPPAATIIADARKCIAAVWREAQPSGLVTAEAEPSKGNSPCHMFLARGEELLRCDRTPLALRTRVAADILQLRGKWPENDGTPATRALELELYNRCLAALTNTMGVTDCSTPE